MAKAVKTRSDSANTIYCPTVIEFILDETGSMSSWKTPTISGFNTFIAEQRAQSGTCLLTLTKFDTTGLKTPYTDLDVQMVPYLNENTFIPGYGTNLRDTIGERVLNLSERLAEWPVQPHVLVVVMTDGEDTSSRRYSETDVRGLIRDHEARGWSFVYLGATRNALAVAEQLGFQPGNAKQFHAEQMHQTMTTLAQATTVYRTERAKAAQTYTSRDFFSGN